MFFAGRGCAVSGGGGAGGGGGGEVVAVRVDTVVVRDTVRCEVPVVSRSLITRVDTVFVRVAGDTVRLAGGTVRVADEMMYLAGDTVRVAAEIPVERKIYRTDDYKAVVEGFRPSLVSLDVYGRTRLVDRVQTLAIPDSRRWSIGVQAGWGFSPKGAAPYVGVGVGYRIVAW